MPMLTMPLVILASARSGILYWNTVFRSGVPFAKLLSRRQRSTFCATQPSGLRPWSISPSVMFRSMRTTSSGIGWPSRASNSASVT